MLLKFIRTYMSIELFFLGRGGGMYRMVGKKQRLSFFLLLNKKYCVANQANIS